MNTIGKIGKSFVAISTIALICKKFLRKQQFEKNLKKDIAEVLKNCPAKR